MVQSASPSVSGMYRLFMQLCFPMRKQFANLLGRPLPYPVFIAGLALLIWHPTITASVLRKPYDTIWNLIHDVVIGIFILSALPVGVQHMKRRSCPLGDVTLLYFALCVISTLPLLIVPTLGVSYVRMLIVSLVTFLAVFLVSHRVTLNRPHRTFIGMMSAWGSWAVVSALRGLERVGTVYGSQSRLDIMGHTNSRAGYELLFFLLLIGFGIHLGRRYRFVVLSLSAILSVSLLTSYSRGAWLALCAGVLYIVAVTRGWRYMILTAVILLVVFTVLPGALGAKAREGVDPSYPTTVFRIGLWKQVIGFIGANPWGGCGYESLWFSAVSWLNPDEPVLVGRHAHNLYLHTWAELGILGLVALIWLMWSVIRFLRKKAYWESVGLNGIRIGVLSCLIALILHGMVDVTWRDYHQQVFFWSLLGWISGVMKGESR